MSTIITRNSTTPGQTPASLQTGELAINVTEGRLYFGSGSTVREFTGSFVADIVTTGSTIYSRVPFTANVGTLENIALGSSAGSNTLSSNNSIFLGNSAGKNADSATNVIYIGSLAGEIAATGFNVSNNGTIFIGANAGRTQTATAKSIVIGYAAGQYNPLGTTTLGDYNIIIGQGLALASNSVGKLNIGGLIFATGCYAETAGFYTGSTGGNVGINVVNPTYNFEASGTIAFPSITTVPHLHVLTYNTSSGQLYYTASSAFGANVAPGGTEMSIQFNSASVFEGAASLKYNYYSQSLQQGLSVVASGEYSHAEGGNTIASGSYSHAEGFLTLAVGGYSHAEGDQTKAIGGISHTEGQYTTALRNYSHAEGSSTVASSIYSHAEGQGTVTLGAYSHAEGFYTATGPVYQAGFTAASTAVGGASSEAVIGGYLLETFHSGSAIVGYGDFITTGSMLFTDTLFSASYDIGSAQTTLYFTTLPVATQVSWIAVENPYNGSHAEGNSTQAIGANSHAEGFYTIASGSYSHAEGGSTATMGVYSHAEGFANYIGGFGYLTDVPDLGGGDQVGIINLGTRYGDISTYFSFNPVNFLFLSGSRIVKGSGTISPYLGGDAVISVSSGELQNDYAREGGVVLLTGYRVPPYADIAIRGEYGHVEGQSNVVYGTGSHAEGAGTVAAGLFSHAEGYDTLASGYGSHAEGQSTIASGAYSHAEGYATLTVDVSSHAEGLSTIAYGIGSHAEGQNTVARGYSSHAEGQNTLASGDYSHAEGFYTVASGSHQHVQGQYNISSSAQSAFIVGNGADNSNRSNLVFAAGSEFQITGSLRTTGSVVFKGLTTANQSNVVTIDTATGQLYYTASSAFGGGGGSGTPGGQDTQIQFNSASAFSGSIKLKYDYVNSNIILTGSILMSGSSSISGVDYLQFDTTAVNTSAVGKMYWNDTDGTLSLGLKGGNVLSELGQGLVTRVVNKTSPLVDLASGSYQVVVVSGAQGQRLAVKLAQANNDANSAGTLGIVAEDIARNQEGFIITVGLLKNRNTTGALQGETWNDGDILYLSPTVAGQITNIKPQAPNHTVIVGYVEYAHQNNGKIYVKIDNGYELDELHNVRITTASLATGDLLHYVSGSNVWVNTRSLSGSYTISGSLTLSGSLTTNDGVNVQTLTASFISASSGITGSLFGTATTASYITASNVIGTVTSASYALTASYVAGGVGYTAVTVTSTPYNASQTSGDIILLVDAATAGGNTTVNLPTAVGNTAKFTVKKIDGGTNSVIVDGNGTETIDGGLTATMLIPSASITIISNNANWFII